MAGVDKLARRKLTAVAISSALESHPTTSRFDRVKQESASQHALLQFGKVGCPGVGIGHIRDDKSPAHIPAFVFVQPIGVGFKTERSSQFV